MGMLAILVRLADGATMVRAARRAHGMNRPQRL